MGILLNRLQFFASVWASFTCRLKPHLSWLHARYKLSRVVWTAVPRGDTSRSHTWNIVPAVRKNSSPEYWIFTSVLVGSSPRSSLLGWFCNRTGTSVNDDARKSNNWLDQWHSGKLSTGSRVESFPRAFPSSTDVPVLLVNQPVYFRDGPYDTAPKYGTESIRYGMLHFRDRRSAASLRHRNRPATTVLKCVNRNSIRYDFHGGVWTYWH